MAEHSGRQGQKGAHRRLRRDRHGPAHDARARAPMRDVVATGSPVAQHQTGAGRGPAPFVVLAAGDERPSEPTLATRRILVPVVAALAAVIVAIALGAVARSEEHTSELQSLTN